MTINFDLLKFHSFNYSKKYNNLWLKNKIKDIEEKIIKNDFYNKINFLIVSKNNSKKIQFHKLNNYHLIHENIKVIIFNIIKTCHPNLYLDIFCKISEDIKIKDIPVIQFEINSRSRCIALIDKKNKVLYPLLFDLKHCFHKIKDKVFDNNAKQEKHEWNFKSRQQEIKNYLLKNN